MDRRGLRTGRLKSLNLNRILTVLGVAILLGLLFGLGLSEVWGYLRRIGIGWLFIIGQETLAILANTAAWNCAFPAEHRRVKFWRLLRMRLAGDGLNYLIPTATVGGEIWRINTLRPETGTPVAAASITLAKFDQFLGQALFIAVGLTVAAPFAPLKPELMPWLWGVLAACLLFLGLIFLALRRGMFAVLLRLIEAYLPRRLQTYLPAEKLAELDSLISTYLGQDRRSFLTSIGLFTVAWALGAVEVFLIFHFLGLPIDAPTAVTVETLSIFIDLVLFFIPAKLGTQEGGKVLIFLSLGLPAAAGLSFGLVRRVRELTWAGVGLACLSSFPKVQAAPDNTGSVADHRPPA
ncbi:MAG: lysylphosphatidylglycerol synthase transmembrane domain-containing protein [Deltaproteobacteria bacterium]|jgi:glycosyltransferase 2 family protein